MFFPLVRVNKTQKTRGISEMKFRLFWLIAALAVIVVIGVSSNSQHQHQIRHAHEIGTLRFYIEGAELTDATREDVTDGTLSQS